MTSIKVLSDELISQIAAGEVIERPASAVKELLENSLDAGASRIAVEIDEAGLKKIRVVDNGCGIRANDARLAFERHATSKITQLEDLFSVRSLGFRGEALASIASIARVVLKSCHKDEGLGVRFEVNGGKEVSFEEEACDLGTDISIFGLFQHTPARKKYMKSERTEYGHVFETISQIALAHPEVGLKLMRDGAEVFDLPSEQSLKERVRVLFSSQTSDALIPVSYQQSNLMIGGFVGKPELARSSKKYQFIFMNDRAIDNRMISHAVKEAFHSLLMHEKHPWYLLNIQIDPSLVDVNVHPRKREVKFVNQQEVYSCVMNTVRHALEANLLSPVVRDEAGDLKAPSAMSFEMPARSVPLKRSFAPAEKIESSHAPTFELKGTVLRPVAQIAHSYIVAESEEGMVLIDQHAAHERVRYAKLMEALEKEEVVKQPLLTPLEMDLGVDSAQIVREHMDDFSAMGFEIEEFGGNTFLVRAVPVGIEKREPEQVIREIIADVTKEWKQNHVKNLREFLLTYTACRGAIKFGDSLNLAEIQALLSEMEETKNCTHCPHGRPAIVTLTFDKLETMFKRKNF